MGRNIMQRMADASVAAACVGWRVTSSGADDMPVLPLRIRKHTTEFGVQWRVTNQGVVISIHRTGEAALEWLHKELVSLQRMQIQQDRNQRLAQMLLKRAQQSTDRELKAKNENR